MTVENTKLVDFISIENETGYVVLTISDHLDWSNELEHLYSLQEKINAYLAFIESGEILEKYPDAEGKVRLIQVMAKFTPPDTEIIEKFFAFATETLNKEGIHFRFTVFNPGREAEARSFN